MNTAQEDLLKHAKKIEGVKLPKFDLNFHERRTQVLDKNLKEIHHEFTEDITKIATKIHKKVEMTNIKAERIISKNKG